MSELISGKEAYFAIGNGESVQKKFRENIYVEFGNWEDLNPETFSLYYMLRDSGNDPQFMFRLKPKTITINGIEVPAPFEPKEGEKYYHLYTEHDNGYGFNVFESIESDCCFMQFGAWRTKEQIKQVVAALRSIFKGE